MTIALKLLHKQIKVCNYKHFLDSMGQLASYKTHWLINFRKKHINSQ